MQEYIILARTLGILSFSVYKVYDFVENYIVSPSRARAMHRKRKNLLLCWL